MSSLQTVVNDMAFARRPVGYFVHHHGHGHAKRCLAITRQMHPRPVTIFCAKPEIFPDLPDNANIVRIPDFHGKQARSEQLHNQPACLALDCAPVGVSAIRGTGGIIASWLAREDPALFVVDVSAELALLGRICSVPVVKIRMHGDRGDQAHQAAYSACAAMLAPYDASLEQADWPSHFRQRTFYTGGLIDTSVAVPSKAEARERLGLSQDQHIFTVVAGNGGVGIPIAPVTLAARAYPDALWLTVGKTVRYGHETDFSNLMDVGWVDNVNDYLAAADVVVATPGDTLTHEIARVGRPLICIPEWCYYDEQACKAQALEARNLAAYSPTWPASFEQWRQLVARANDCDIPSQHLLVDDQAARRAADYLEGLIRDLWLESRPDELAEDELPGLHRAMTASPAPASTAYEETVPGSE
ncbi:glycosyltransferase family protein [Marinobacter fonticola]|uniref:glycosyl transferase n=1 Tax=Marinobacter fonticola TaxID=2603215 RepID=UPI0011E73633|nr:glycosyl transferase [Marinobacter fonticola]